MLRLHWRCLVVVWSCWISIPLAAEPIVATPLRQSADAIAGALVIAGGGNLPDEVLNRFLELAGGATARIVYIPTASGSDPESDNLATSYWKQHKAASVSVLLAHRSGQADEPTFIQPLKEATGVWLGGGDQSKLTESYRNTLVERELHRLLARGGVIGGTSAGAAMMSPLMITGGANPATLGPGFGFLPGVVVDQHFLKRNRVDRLLGVLARHPGYAGIGIDEQTAVVVRGRSLTVLGNSFALLCLSASGPKPASVQVLKAGERADLVALSRAAVARAQPPFPPAKPESPIVTGGTLMIGGGGRLADDLWKRFIDLAGGPNALIVVVPTANDDPLPAEPAEARLLKKAGARNLKIRHTRSRSEANKDAFWSPLLEARGVWFSGGRQWRFVDAYEGTAAEKAFHAVLARGGVIGGSSAGASIQSEYMPRGDPLGNRKIIAEGYERGFGFLKGVAVDQHFFARKRQPDMTELMAAYPQLLGIGIDEGTVIIVSGSIMEVAGKSKIAVYDRKKPAATPDYEELPPGTRYDLVARKRL